MIFKSLELIYKSLELMFKSLELSDMYIYIYIIICGILAHIYIYILV